MCEKAYYYTNSSSYIETGFLTESTSRKLFIISSCCSNIQQPLRLLKHKSPSLRAALDCSIYIFRLAQIPCDEYS